VCSTAFATLGRAQARALGHPDLPIAVIAHPFGIRTRDEVRQIAARRFQLVEDRSFLAEDTHPRAGPDDADTRWIVASYIDVEPTTAEVS